MKNFESLNIKPELLRSEEQVTNTETQYPTLDFDMLQENPESALFGTIVLAGAAALIYFGSIKDRL